MLYFLLNLNNFSLNLVVAETSGEYVFIKMCIFLYDAMQLHYIIQKYITGFVL